MYMIIDDANASWKSYEILYIFERTWYNLAPNGLATKPIDLVKSIYS